jgi:hypothetical protein
VGWLEIQLGTCALHHDDRFRGLRASRRLSVERAALVMPFLN